MLKSCSEISVCVMFFLFPLKNCPLSAKTFSSVLMSGGGAKISGLGSVAGPMKSFHDVIYVLALFRILCFVLT